MSPLCMAKPVKSPESCSQRMLVPSFPAPKNPPESPWMVNVPPLPKAAVHEPNTPSARILAPSGNPGQRPNSPFLGTGSPAFVHPMRRIAFCLAAASRRGTNFVLMFRERWTTSDVPAMGFALAPCTNIHPFGGKVIGGWATGR